MPCSASAATCKAAGTRSLHRDLDQLPVDVHVLVPVLQESTDRILDHDGIDVLFGLDGLDDVW